MPRLDAVDDEPDVALWLRGTFGCRDGDVPNSEKTLRIHVSDDHFGVVAEGQELPCRAERPRRTDGANSDDLSAERRRCESRFKRSDQNERDLLEPFSNAPQSSNRQATARECVCALKFKAAI